MCTLLIGCNVCALCCQYRIDASAQVTLIFVDLNMNMERFNANCIRVID